MSEEGSSHIFPGVSRDLDNSIGANIAYGSSNLRQSETISGED